jgi:ribosomal protein S18 acetylase RimI-like enzyme
VIERANQSDLDAVREIMRQYAASTGVDLSFQNFDQELATLLDFYEVILVARLDENVAGCVALRQIDRDTCEMKRLYVRPSARGHGFGRALATRIIEEARARNYKRMRLDTLPSMRQAMALYESLGFRDIEPYRFNPVEGSRFLELAL